jgi:DNA-binding winged helix-turn-helix (wHTH) protein/tetratricopeptide (TPR) repeat protein
LGATQRLLRFGTFELNLATEELRKNGIPLKLSPQPFRILAMLAGNSGQIVTREEIRQQVWGGETYVDFEHGMNQCIKQIRTVLGDNTDNPVYVETLPRKGYRFLAPVTVKTIEAQPAVVESKSGLHSLLPAIIGRARVAQVSRSQDEVLSASDLGTLDAVGVPAPTAAAAAPARVRTPIPRATGHGSWVRVALVTVVVVALVGGVVYWHSQRANALTERDTVVLADFKNSTGDVAFDDTLKQALAIQLEQSPLLAVLSDRKVIETLELMNRPVDERITKQVAAEVCLRNNSKLLLEGSIAAIGDHYLITLKATNCQTGDTIASAVVEAENRNQVVEALGQAGNQLRKKLGESRPSVEKFNTPLARATTSSLEALEAFTQAQKMLSQSSAIPYLKRALELDPNFARAYASLGAVYRNLGDTKSEIENFNKAYELRDRVSQRERFQIEGYHYAFVTGQIEEAIATYSEWIQTYPEDPAPHGFLGFVYTELGRYQKAEIEMLERIRHSGHSGHSDTNLIGVYVCLNRLDDAQALLEQARREDDSPVLRETRYSVAFLRGDNAAMQEQLAWAVGRPGVEDRLISAQSDTEAYYGRIAKARQLSEAAVQSAERAEVREAAAKWRANEALREADIGNSVLARRRAAEALALNTEPEVEVKAALALARAGDVARAQRLVDKLNQDFPLDTMMQNYWLPAIRAAIELGKSNPSDAVDILNVATSYELGSTFPGVAAFGSLYPAYLRGQAYLETGQAQQAAAEFQKILDHPGLLGNYTLGALAHLQRGRAQAMTGDQQSARKSYQDFFALWKDADPDVPVLKQAKAEYAKLQPEIGK